jgi:hypothetical protein
VCVLDLVWGYKENSPSSERWPAINDTADDGDGDGNDHDDNDGSDDDDDDDDGDDDASSRALRDMGSGRHCCPAMSSSLSAASLSFADYTCGSFLAREMVRYAKRDAAFAFVVGLSIKNDRMRTGAHPGKCILLGLGGWRM